MTEIPRISEAEWLIMEVIWDQQPITAHQILAALAGKTEWKLNTLKTLLNRLVKKNALHFTPRGKQFHYSAMVAREECLGEESVSFLDRFFGGSLTPMLAHFVEKRGLSGKEAEALRSLLDEKQDDQ